MLKFYFGDLEKCSKITIQLQKSPSIQVRTNRLNIGQFWQNLGQRLEPRGDRFRKLAIKHHPDKGGDPETFKEITRAHEVRRGYFGPGTAPDLESR